MNGALIHVHPAGWLSFPLISKFEDLINHKDKQAMAKPTAIRAATSVEKSLDVLLSFKETSFGPTARIGSYRLTYRRIECNQLLTI